MTDDLTLSLVNDLLAEREDRASCRVIINRRGDRGPWRPVSRGYPPSIGHTVEYDLEPITEHEIAPTAHSNDDADGEWELFERRATQEGLNVATTNLYRLKRHAR